MKVSTTAQRIREIMRERGLRQVDILQMAEPISRKYNIDLTKGNLAMYVTGRVLPGQDKLLILAEALDVSEAWLMGYDVPKERKALAPDVLISGLNSSAVDDIALVLKDDDSRRRWLDYARILADLKRADGTASGKEE